MALVTVSFVLPHNSKWMLTKFSIELYIVYKVEVDNSRPFGY